MTLWYIYGTKYLHGTCLLLNILMILGIKDKSFHFDPYNVFLAVATLKTGFVLQGHIYFEIKMEKVFAVYTDCTLITIQLSLVKYLSKIRRHYWLFSSSIFDFWANYIFFVNYTYINIIILIYYYYYIWFLKRLILLCPVTSEYIKL